MAWNPFSRKRSSANSLKSIEFKNEGGADAPPVQDTRAAIEELSQVVKNDPEAVEIYLALGNLYRSQGEIERAIQIRNSLIVRPGLDRKFKARAFFELGRDFRRGGFLDRAEKSFEKAQAFGHAPVAIHHEIARLAFERGAFEKAAEAYGHLNLPLPQANSLVRLAIDYFEEGKDSQGHRALRHAIRAYPGAVEAWLERMVHAYKAGNDKRIADIFQDALQHVPQNLRFILLEGLLQSFKRTENKAVNSAEKKEFLTLSEERISSKILSIIQEQEPDVLLLYYGAVFLLRLDMVDEAKVWLEKALIIQPTFWLGRLELFELSKYDQTLTPFFSEQLSFFVGHARNVRRFYCRHCGLKRDQLFFNCPKCRSWHSIAFRSDFSQ